MIKEVSASEEQFYPAKINWQYLLSLDREDVDTEQARVHDFYYKTMFIKKFGNTILSCSLLFWNLTCGYCLQMPLVRWGISNLSFLGS